jgi:hypothetical protein
MCIHTPGLTKPCGKFEPSAQITMPDNVFLGQETTMKMASVSNATAITVKDFTMLHCLDPENVEIERVRPALTSSRISLSIDVAWQDVMHRS